ncbi:hypothetical protein GBAR_LOCUS29381 [Geodia barretti]|uniref:Uncharacterized protein n=1 Tax=Geodia barretti TaxID=519541 RepID=A0AA35TTQ8_GEOBA|nr:hypothetical protein GBAR_LOCUS29381 [Geodia barretti]
MYSTSSAVAILILCHVHQASAQPRIVFIVPPLMVFVFVSMVTLMLTITCCFIWRQRRAQRAAGVPTSIFPTTHATASGANFATVQQTSPVILSAPAGETPTGSAYPQQPSGSDYQPFQEPREVKKGDATLADFTF